jgi:hypothetical protein
LQVTVPINLVKPADIPAAPTSLADQNARIAQFTNAFNNQIGGAFGPTNNLADPRFDNVNQVKSVGSSSYNSLQLEAIRRSRSGLTLDANYTWSHSLDDISDALGVLINDSAGILDASKPLSFNRSNSQFDIRNRFALSYNYEPPFTKHFHGIKRYLLDGWSQSGIVTAQSGLPATVFAAPIAGISDLLLNGTNTGNTAVNTALNGDATKLNPVPFFTGYKVPTSLPVSEPLLEHDGTSGRNHLRLAGLTDVDLAISKLIRISEGKNFQLRWESFNVLNHPNFGGYVNNFSSSRFDTYTLTSTNMRQMQVSAKFIF